ncbi:hypothetical protein PR002_g23984 [Phytophthora rubi]|uniref:Secreted protein n=1 Tax=Phytophthora rubi TaxID=129364 RepID=A0A6A3ILB6_9STRA|nr:hypothetical protein PR002_g23984 [Phytophthora rubi]
MFTFVPAVWLWQLQCSDLSCWRSAQDAAMPVAPRSTSTAADARRHGVTCVRTASCTLAGHRDNTAGILNMYRREASMRLRTISALRNKVSKQSNRGRSTVSTERAVQRVRCTDSP